MIEKKLKTYLNASVIGLSILFSILIGLAIGLYLDKIFNTKPYLTIFFLIMGVLAGFKNMVYFIKKTKVLENDRDD
jgi:ATP synthase protein I